MSAAYFQNLLWFYFASRYISPTLFHVPHVVELITNL